MSTKSVYIHYINKCKEYLLITLTNKKSGNEDTRMISNESTFTRASLFIKAYYLPRLTLERHQKTYPLIRTHIAML